jgi:putative restriction endonuclease
MKKAFTKYILANNTTGSRKAPSYLQAIELINKIFSKTPHLHKRYGDIWSIQSVEVADELYLYILAQQKQFRDGKGIFVGESPKSYWDGGFCSAAIKSYKEFLILHPYEERLWTIYNNTSKSPDDISKEMLSKKINSIEKLIDDKDFDFSTKEGKEKLSLVKQRVNQNFFRKMILKTYESKCCITGLNIPEVLRASHITAWANDKTNRMNPENGLCLSATYDAAFDRHLISFDEDYRMLLSPNLKEYTTNKAFNEYFIKFEGKQIALPKIFLPSMQLLEKHRKKTLA